MNSKIWYMKITREDINFLYYLYRFRCLSTRQVRSYFYDFSSYYKEKIVPMVSSQLIELKNNGTDYYVMITQKGIMLFQRYLNIPNEIYNAETGKNEKSVLRASEVVIEEKFVQHQSAGVKRICSWVQKKTGKYRLLWWKISQWNENNQTRWPY